MTDFYRRSVSLVIGTAGVSKSNVAIHGMQSQLSPYQIRDNIPMFALHGLISRPLPGAQMLVLYGDNDPSKAVCVGVNDPRYNMQGLADGVVGLAQHMGANILFFDNHIQIEGNAMPVVLNNCGQVTINSSSKVRIEADLEVTGEITARSDGAAVHVSTHHHTGVLTGGGNTGGPVG